MQESEVLDVNVPKSGRLRQITSSFIMSLAPLNSGMIAGWMSPMSLILMGKDSPVGVISKEELSILAALPNYFVLLFAPAFSVVVNCYGRRPGLHLVGILSVVSGVIITYSTSKAFLYFGRLSAGFSTFAVALSPMYVTETVHDSFRGVLTSFCTIQLNLGVLISYIAGTLLTYKEYNIIMIVIPIIFTLLSFWFPESPHFLFDQSRKGEALNSLLWYGGQNQKVAKAEFESLESSNALRIPVESTNFIELFKSNGTRRALNISICLTAFQTLSGIQVVLNYNELIYEEVSSPMSSNNSSILSAALILCGSCVGILIVDVLGRKPLLYLSFVIGSICMTILSIFLLLLRTGRTMTDHGWIPFACLNIFVFVYGIGLNFVPGLISNEVTQSRMRPTVSAVTTVFVIILVIIVIQSFPFLDENVGLYSVFVVPAVMNLFGGLFTWLVVPETKGKSLIQITEELNRT